MPKIEEVERKKDLEFTEDTVMDWIGISAGISHLVGAYVKKGISSKVRGVTVDAFGITLENLQTNLPNVVKI